MECEWAGARHVTVDNSGGEADLSVLDTSDSHEYCVNWLISARRDVPLDAGPRGFGTVHPDACIFSRLSILFFLLAVRPGR